MPNHSVDVDKLVEELIQKHQAEADDLTLSEKAKYGDSSTVSTYTWVHSMKAMSQKFVRDLLDIQTALDEQPTISPDEVRGVGEWEIDEQEVGGIFGGRQIVKIPCCSNCGTHNEWKTNYCPNCGARMKGAEDGN